MQRYIAIPIYDHTSAAEIAEIMQELDRLGFARSPYVVTGELPDPGPDATPRCQFCGSTASEWDGEQQLGCTDCGYDAPECDGTHAHPKGTCSACDAAFEELLADNYSDLPPSGSTSGV